MARKAAKPKTAVVLIHGMGEPTPLENIRSFVNTVYAQDTRLAHTAGAAAPLATSIVPDAATGSAELRRITTHDDGPDKRTDFFEFYWADIMDGTPIELVTSWIQALLLRPPWRVPRSVRVFTAWLLLWLLALIVVFFAIVTLYPDWMERQQFVKAISAWLYDIKDEIGLGLLVLGMVWLLVRIALVFRSSEPSIHALQVRLPLILIVVGFFLPQLPQIELRYVAAAVAFGVGWLMHTFVGPYFGDVVRYVRATPKTVEKRRLVRERGLALLEALHAKRADGDDLEHWAQATTSDPPCYDRIVVVGHSLGSIVAYDLLQLFWEKHGPTHHQDWKAGATDVQTALRKCDLYTRCAVPTARRLGKSRVFRDRELRAFVIRQEQLRVALGDGAPRWRITDLITLGSPLVHAEFLLADSTEEVEQGFVERRFAASPPRPDPLSKTNSMLFFVGRTKYPHFAAQFAAVRWTNICDVHPVPAFGDLVSGQLRPVFGPGIDEHDIPIRNPRRWGLFQRIFTHTRYWDWHESYADVPGALPAKLGANVPAHIAKLRAALKLGT